MNKQQREDAIRFNRQRPYSVAIWRKIQGVIGAVVDGDPGPETASMVFKWQTRGVEADGCAGRKTLEAMGLDLAPIWGLDAIRAVAGDRAVGIDVSSWQGRIRWNDVRGVDFVYMRSSIAGRSVDERFRENWRGAQSAGIPRGAYHLGQMVWEGQITDPRREAQNLARVLGDDPGELVPALDLENKLVRPLFDRVGAGGVADWIEAWLDEAEASGLGEAILYVSWHTAQGMIEARPTLTERAHWWPFYPAPWGPPPKVAAGWAPGAIRQISDEGIVAGIDTNVDLNIAQVPVASLQLDRGGCA